MAIKDEVSRALAPRDVTAILNFIRTEMKERPFLNYEQAPSGEVRNILMDPHRVRIRNLRAKRNNTDFRLDTSGFQIVEHKTALKSFSNEEDITSFYYKETEELIMQITGASRVHVFNHVVRLHGPRPERAGHPGVPAITGIPALRVHIDQSPSSAIERVKQHMGQEAEKLSRGRGQIINAWRPIRGPVQDVPLAYCDYRTLDPNDLVPTDLRFTDRVSETYSLRYNAGQKWYFLDQQQPHEVLLMKIYESDLLNGGALLTPHTAFLNPLAPPNALPRQSIDARALVFYGPN